MSSPRTKSISNDPQLITSHQIFSVDTWTKIGHSLSLSPRELDVVKGVFDDDNEQVIAEALSISAHTVHTHVWRLYQKLEVHSRAGLVVRIFSEFLSLYSGTDGPH